jgi:N-acyl homoserine lactone hydrolase
LRIHSISTGHVRVHASQVHGRGRALRRLNVLRDREWTPPLPIHAWAIEHPEGLILVDTGEVHEASDPRHYPMSNPYLRRAIRFDVTVGDEIDRQLIRRGLSAEQVRWVVLTHLHTDHAGGLRDRRRPRRAGRGPRGGRPAARLPAPAPAGLVQPSGDRILR